MAVTTETLSVISSRYYMIILFSWRFSLSSFLHMCQLPASISPVCFQMDYQQVYRHRAMRWIYLCL